MLAFLSGGFQYPGGFLQGREDRPVGLRVRMLDAEIAVAVVGRVDHGADIIQVGRHVLVHLSHRHGIDLAADDGPEHVRRHIDSLGGKAVVGVGRKFCDHVRLGTSPGLRLVEHHVPHSPLRAEADVVKLHLVEAHGRRLRADLHQVIPHLLAVGVHPGQPGTVPEHAAVRQLQTPFRLLLRQPGIPECHHPGDDIEAVLLLQLPDQLPHILHVGRAGLRLRHQGGVHGTGHPSAVVLQIYDHRVDLRVRDVGQNSLHHLLVSGGRAAQIDSLHLNRLTPGLLRLCLRLRLRSRFHLHDLRGSRALLRLRRRICGLPGASAAAQGQQAQSHQQPSSHVLHLSPGFSVFLLLCALSGQYLISLFRHQHRVFPLG